MTQLGKINSSPPARMILAAAVLLGGAGSLLAGCSAQSQTQSPAEAGKYQTEAAAQAHCPSDTVLWLNSRVNVFHTKDSQWYGKTAHGAYVCKADAQKMGGRFAGNGE